MRLPLLMTVLKYLLLKYFDQELLELHFLKPFSLLYCHALCITAKFWNQTLGIRMQSFCQRLKCEVVCCFCFRGGERNVACFEYKMLSVKLQTESIFFFKTEQKEKKRKQLRTNISAEREFPGDPVVKTVFSSAGGMSSIPCQEPRSHLQYGLAKKKKKS